MSRNQIPGKSPSSPSDSCTNPPDEEVSTRNLVFLFRSDARYSSQHQAQVLNVTPQQHTSCLVVVRASPARRRSRFAKAGLQFPVGRIARATSRLASTPPASVPVPSCLAAVLEYLAAEVLELAGNASRDNKKTRIVPHTSSWRSATMRSSSSSARHHRLRWRPPQHPLRAPPQEGQEVRLRLPGVLRASPPQRTSIARRAALPLNPLLINGVQILTPPRNPRTTFKIFEKF